MGAAVAIHTSCRAALARLDGLSMEALFIRRLLVRVAGCAADLFGCVLVRRAFYVGVAIDTSEHAAVNRTFELVWIDVQANGFAIYLM